MTAVADQFTDALSVRTIFGDPIERRHVTLIPVGVVAGGGGGDVNGAGFGGVARPLGALVIEDGRARWLPTPDITKILTIAGIALAVLLVFRTTKRRRARKARKRNR